MHIAHVTATFPPYYAGTGMVCYYNALELARRGHQVTVFTAAHPRGEYAYPEEITVRRLPVLIRFGNAPVLPGLMALKGFDIIHLHLPFIFGAEIIRAVSKIRHIPYLITHHNDLIGDGLRRYLFDAYLAVSTRLVYENARKFAVVSLDHAAACRLAPLFRKRWADVVEIPNGVDTDLFRPGLDGTPVRWRYGIADHAPVILFVGSLDRAHHYRRVDLLLKAVRVAQDPNWCLLVVGSGDLAPHYQGLAESLGVGPQVRFLGKVIHRDLPQVYAAADIVVLPSQLQESFGLILIEAMACGKPVIASNLPGARSVVNDDEDGLLVEPGNIDDLVQKLHRLLEAPQRREEMGKRGRAKVEEKYAWPKIIPKLLNVYADILQSDCSGS